MYARTFNHYLFCPLFPSSNSIMIASMATSRGRGLSFLEGYKGAQLHVTPGVETAHRTIDIIKSSHTSSDKPIFKYFIKGLLNLTFKKKKIRITYQRHEYQETIINESATQIHRRVEIFPWFRWRYHKTEFHSHFRHHNSNVHSDME